MTTSAPVTAAAAGTWKLGDRTVNRMGFGAMRLPQTGRALIADAASGDRDRAIAVLRRAVELGVNHIDTAAFYFSPGPGSIGRPPHLPMMFICLAARPARPLLGRTARADCVTRPSSAGVSSLPVMAANAADQPATK
jgi:hypothetical protein